MTQLPTMVELTAAELDAVYGGAPPMINAGNLIGVQLGDVTLNRVVSVDRNDVTIEVEDNEIVKNVNVVAGIAVAVLSGATGNGIVNRFQ